MFSVRKLLWNAAHWSAAGGGRPVLSAETTVAIAWQNLSGAGGSRHCGSVVVTFFAPESGRGSSVLCDFGREDALSCFKQVLVEQGPHF